MGLAFSLSATAIGAMEEYYLFRLYGMWGEHKVVMVKPVLSAQLGIEHFL
jgi:hypothetical protein